jgi:hypothetical protein
MNNNGNKINKTPLTNGFATLLGVLIVFIVAIAIATTILLIGTTSSKIMLVQDNFYKAKATADACAEIALQKLKDDPTFSGADHQSVEDSNCDYSVSNNLQGDGTREISLESTGNSGDVVRKVKISANISNPLPPELPLLSVTTWQEVPDF